MDTVLSPHSAIVQIWCAKRFSQEISTELSVCTSLKLASACVFCAGVALTVSLLYDRGHARGYQCHKP